MARPTVPRRYPTLTVGNYRSVVDTTGVDPDPDDRTKILGQTRMRQPGDTSGVAPKSSGHSAWEGLLKLFRGGK